MWYPAAMDTYLSLIVPLLPGQNIYKIIQENNFNLEKKADLARLLALATAELSQTQLPDKRENWWCHKDHLQRNVSTNRHDWCLYTREFYPWRGTFLQNILAGEWEMFSYCPTTHVWTTDAFKRIVNVGKRGDGVAYPLVKQSSPANIKEEHTLVSPPI